MQETAHTTISMVTMFQEADLFMKVLTIGLLLASVFCWAIIFDKSLAFRRLRNKMRQFEKKFWAGGSLDQLYASYAKAVKDPLASIFVAAVQELKRLLGEKKKHSDPIKVQERIEKTMQIAIDKQLERMETKMVFLASTSSVAPLTGLFGTM